MIKNICYIIITMCMIVIAVTYFSEMKNNNLTYEIRLIEGRRLADSKEMCDLHDGFWEGGKCFDRNANKDENEEK